MQTGKFVGSRPPYGYLKASSDCHKLVVDEDAARFVRLIFQWAETGKSLFDIVRLLNSMKIATPSHYKLQAGIIENEKLLGNGRWQVRTVLKILSSEVYTGKLVQGKTERQIVVENTHEPIISPEQYAGVQAILNLRQENAPSSATPYSPNLFLGKVFCAHCGGRLDREKNGQHYIYCCVANFTAPGSCIGSTIREATLISAVSEQFRAYAGIADESPADMLDTEQVQFELAQIQVELSGATSELQALYEGMLEGALSDDEYAERKAEFEHRTVQLERRQKRLLLQQQDRLAVEKENGQLQALLREFMSSRKLTRELIERLLVRIDVQNDGVTFVELRIFD